ATVVGILAASIQLVPLAEVAALAARTPDKYAATNSLPPAALLAWPFPSLFGHPAHGDYVGGFLFFRHYSGLYGVSTGAVSLALAILGAATRRRAAIALSAVVVVLVALAAPALHAAAAVVVPGLDALHVTRVLVVVYLLQALLAADGADAILEARHQPRLALALPLGMLALVAALELGRATAGADAGRFWLHVRYLARHGTLLASPRIFVPLALAGAGALFAHRRWRWTHLALPALAAVEVIALALPNFGGAPSREIRPPTEVTSQLRAAVAAQPGRMVGLTEPDSFPPALGDHLPANSAAADGFADLRAFLRIPPAPMTELVASAAPSGSFEYFAVRDVDLPLYDLLDVRWVLSAHALDPARFVARAPGLYENPRALGRAFFTRCSVVESDAERRLGRLTARDFSPWSAVILSAPVTLAPACSADAAPLPVAVVDADATTTRLSLDAPADGFVVLADAWFPGWRVAVDGVPGELLRVDHALRGVLVPRGRHAIEFHYAPDALADGAWLSLVAWLLIAAAAAWDRLRRVRLSDDALIALGAGVLLAAFVGRDLLPNDNDALYAGVIRTLRHGGSFIDLRLGTVPFLDKPPLFFWLGALVTGVFGESALALRLVPVAAGILGAVLVARTTRRLTGSRAAAVFAAFALATAPNYYEYARRVYMEVPTAVLGFWAFDLGVRERWKRAGVAAGLAFMLKSVVGVLGFGALVVAHLLRRRLPRGLVLAAAIALAIFVPWHLLAWRANPTAFIDFTLNLHVKHQIAEAQPWSRGGPLFYLQVLAVQDTVIGLCLLAGVIVAARDFRRTRSFELGALLLAVALQLALYTVSATKKPFYILTMYPFAAVLGARALAPFLDGKIGVSMTATRSRALVFVALSLIFVSRNGALLYPSLDERETTYVAPLARRMDELAPPGTRLYSYEIYLAAPQFYSGRDTIYALGDAPTVAMLARIPYLRYAHDVVTWSDDLLRSGAWVLAPIDRAPGLIARAPGTQVVARNQGFALLKGP
ncbi:MAG: glycosyltransferase family 39 protein, partial [Polyangia bacterium]